MLDRFLLGDSGLAPANYPALFLSLLLAFLSGQLLAWVYMKTHSGLSYSRAFVVSLLLMPVIVAMVMLVMSNNLVTAFGLMAVFAIVRFRNMLRDTLDTSYVLAGIVIGMACGLQKYTSAVIGASLLGCLLLYVWVSAFGTRHRHDLILQLRKRPGSAGEAPLQGVFRRHCLTVTPAGRNHSLAGGEQDQAYRLLLRDPARVVELLDELRSLEGVSSVNCTLAADESEL